MFTYPRTWNPLSIAGFPLEKKLTSYSCQKVDNLRCRSMESYLDLKPIAHPLFLLAVVKKPISQGGTELFVVYHQPDKPFWRWKAFFLPALLGPAPFMKEPAVMHINATSGACWFIPAVSPSSCRLYFQFFPFSPNLDLKHLKNTGSTSHSRL